MGQPLNEVTIPRAWHWGVVFLVDKRGAIPDVDPDTLVSVGPSGLVLLARHAQDTFEVVDGKLVYATATVHTRLLTEPVEDRRPVVFDGVVATPSGQLSVGDADSEVIISAHHSQTRFVISVLDPQDNSPDDLWVDMIPARSVAGTVALMRGFRHELRPCGMGGRSTSKRR